jgi:GNAT superfamily N-acetyltransferase
MVRADLLDLPRYPLPPGYGIRWHQPGDEPAWAALQAPFYDPGAITAGSFGEWFGTDAAAHEQRIAYLIDPAGRPAGTAAAWTYDGFRSPEWGRLHWVAMAGEQQGQGLSKPLLSAVLQRMVDLGHTAAYLTTDVSRPVAVALYRRFGFVPLAGGREEAAGG